jgi:hypothetical protein
MFDKNSASKGGTKLHAHLLPFMVLVFFGMITLVGVVSADSVFHGAPPVTNLSGVVNGSVDVKMSDADTWNLAAPGREEQQSWGNMTLAVTPSDVDLEFARLYVVVYGGNMNASYTGNMTVQLYNGNTPGDVLVTGKVLNLPYNAYDPNYNNPAYDPSVVFPLVNLSRVTSDYIAVFDIKDNISNMNTDNFNVSVTTYNVTGSFDARVKTVQLAYGWNMTSDSTGDTKYWINEGHDPMTKYVSSDAYNMTWFNDTGITNQQYDATLWVDYLAGADGEYKWNSNEIAPDVLYQWKYAGLNCLTWSNPDYPYMQDDNSLEYARGTNSWYKINFAVLAIK